MKIIKLGLVDYQPTFEAMKKFNAERTPETEDELWLVEHPPVFTQGLAGKPEHLLLTSDIPVVQIGRGGQITYHGPRATGGLHDDKFQTPPHKRAQNRVRVGKQHYRHACRIRH